MKEKAYRFGKDDCLTGIVAAPDNYPKTDIKPAVVLLNAGILHRVGPYRLHVDLARKLVSMNFTVLRFDLSGMPTSLRNCTIEEYIEIIKNAIKEGTLKL